MSPAASMALGVIFPSGMCSSAAWRARLTVCLTPVIMRRSSSGDCSVTMFRCHCLMVSCHACDPSERVSSSSGYALVVLVWAVSMAVSICSRSLKYSVMFPATAA